MKILTARHETIDRMQELNKRRRRRYLILSILVILLYIGAISVNIVLERLVKNEIFKQLNDNPESLYTLTYEEVHIKVFRGHLTVKNIEVVPSDSAMTLLHEGRVRKLIHSRIPEFKIKGLQALDLILHKKINVNDILVKGIMVDYMINFQSDKPENKNTFALHSLFSDNFNEASVGSVQITTKDLKFISIDQDQELFSIDSVNFYVDEILINKETLEQTIPVRFNDFRLNTGHFVLNSMEHYRIVTKDVMFDADKASLTIEGFELIPKHSKDGYNKIIQYNNDWFSIKTDNIKFNGLSPEELEFAGILSFESLEINAPLIDIYRDKRLPDAPFKYKSLLAGLIHKIPIDLNIDTLKIRDAKLRYEEQTDASDAPGTVFFDPLKLTAYHVTNNPDLIAADPSMIIELEGKIMAESVLLARLDVDLSSDQEVFSIEGTLEPVSGTVFNPMVERLLPISIKSCDIHKTAFRFTANDDVSEGTLTLEYENLVIDVTKGKENHKKANLISLVASGFIKHHNLPDKGKYHTGTIRFERRKDKAIVNFLWNSVKTGVISVVAPIADQNRKVEKQERKDEKKAEREARRARN